MRSIPSKPSRSDASLALGPSDSLGKRLVLCRCQSVMQHARYLVQANSICMMAHGCKPPPLTAMHGSPHHELSLIPRNLVIGNEMAGGRQSTAADILRATGHSIREWDLLLYIVYTY